jgi:hypothetical protein
MEHEFSGEFNDFGFTVVDEKDLEAYQQAEELSTTIVKASAAAKATEKKIDDLYNAIQPLLNNLKLNPSKEYILWPDRKQKVEEFEAYLKKIYNS